MEGFFLALIYVGCAGYSYDDWKGVFYPKGMVKSDYLQYYAKYFNFTEIDATFYNIPSQDIVRHWDKHTPSDFRFAIKVWKDITHKLESDTLLQKLTLFFHRMSVLDQKISAYLLQFPSKFKYSKNHEKQLSFLLENLSQKHEYFLELRDNSWFQSNFLNQLKTYSNIQLGTVYLDGVIPFYLDNQKKYYIRVIKDRTLDHFSKQQRKETAIMNNLINKVITLMRTPSIEDIFVIFNNHFRGFSPEDVTEFKQLLGLPVKKYNNTKNLLDFL